MHTVLAGSNPPPHDTTTTCNPCSVHEHQQQQQQQHLPAASSVLQRTLCFGAVPFGGFSSALRKRDTTKTREERNITTVSALLPRCPDAPQT